MEYNDDEFYQIIKDYPDYAISTYGRVLSLKDKNKPIILKPYLKGRPALKYMCVDLCKDNKKKSKRIHILVAQAFIENPEPEKYNLVDHIDSKQRFNNSVSNLRWADDFMQSQNRECVINAKNIELTKHNTYRIRIERNGKKHNKSFATEQEAIDYRKEFLAKYAEQQSA